MTGYDYYLCLGLHCYIGFLGNDVVHVAKLVIIFGFQDSVGENSIKALKKSAKTDALSNRLLPIHKIVAHASEVFC